jgi:putative flippase GtrA
VRLLAAARATRFIAIGVASTLAYMLLYVLLRTSLSAGAANALALGTTAVANTAANRRLTFAVRGRDHLLRQHAFGAGVFLLALGLTTTALWVLRQVVASPPHAVEAIVLATASLAATVARYVALTLVFDRRRDSRLGQRGPARDSWATR